MPTFDFPNNKKRKFLMVNAAPFGPLALFASRREEGEIQRGEKREGRKKGRGKERGRGGRGVKEEQTEKRGR